MCIPSFAIMPEVEWRSIFIKRGACNGNYCAMACTVAGVFVSLLLSAVQLLPVSVQGSSYSLGTYVTYRKTTDACLWV